MMELISAKELAELLGVKRPSILQRLRKGKLPIPALKLENTLVRFRRKDVEEYLEGLKSHPGTKKQEEAKEC